VPAALSCAEVAELVTAYLDGGLRRRLRRRVAHHLAGCGGCTALVAQLHELLRLLPRFEQASPDPLLVMAFRVRVTKRRPR
jgi:predicted anti-sigma-YlaC factor YlaD